MLRVNFKKHLRSLQDKLILINLLYNPVSTEDGI